MDEIDRIKVRLSYMESRRERLVQKMGKEEFESAVREIMCVLQKNNLDKSPTARDDLFEYVNAVLT